MQATLNPLKLRAAVPAGALTTQATTCARLPAPALRFQCASWEFRNMFESHGLLGILQHVRVTRPAGESGVYTFYDTGFLQAPVDPTSYSSLAEIKIILFRCDVPPQFPKHVASPFRLSLSLHSSLSTARECGGGTRPSWWWPGLSRGGWGRGFWRGG